ncbi:uncharacterized protein BXZ73DRAFT_95438 [Epithele typhae]|uniref:uncharacterized protein n=1 Tax=Epithele typhae TaxID=378194 RepID=UPI002008ACF0|nr:uncharacterized protein BXZ73DRAFT_95438 [Epithele typhae]KAH9945917.1 hypothetical protein BXZ73DRAFT_95438 [Epithele typhae]
MDSQSAEDKGKLPVCVPIAAVHNDALVAHTALKLLEQACAGAIDCLRQPISIPQASTVPSTHRPALAVLHKDFQALLTLVYTSTTKPRRCATLFDPHGRTLAADVRRRAGDVCAGVRVFAAGLVGAATDDHLVHAGAVHELVERAREAPEGNLAAVKERWRADRTMMRDSAEEVDAMVDEGRRGRRGGGGGGEEEEDGFGDDDLDAGDEWDELGLGTSKRMSAAELERTKKIQPLVRFVTLYHKRVFPDVLNALAESPAEAFNAQLDALPSLSDATVRSLEEVVAALYAPQKLEALADAVGSMASAINAVHEVVATDTLTPPPDLTQAMGQLSVDGASSCATSVKKTKDPRKWFRLVWRRYTK